MSESVRVNTLAPYTLEAVVANRRRIEPFFNTSFFQEMTLAIGVMRPRARVAISLQFHQHRQRDPPNDRNQRGLLGWKRARLIIDCDVFTGQLEECWTVQLLYSQAVLILRCHHASGDDAPASGRASFRVAPPSRLRDHPSSVDVFSSL